MYHFWSLVTGYDKVEFCGTMIHRFINICKKHKIYLWHICYENQILSFCVLHADYQMACACAQKCDACLKIKASYGIPAFYKKHRRNIYFFTGFAGAMLLIYMLSRYIWDIEIVGNYYYSQSTLAAYLETEGAGCGSKKSEIIPSDIEENLRIHYPKIAWVSAQIIGTRLIVSIEESTENMTVSDVNSARVPEEKTKSQITADMDGTVISIITRRGTPMVHAGDVVEKGTVLIKGSVDIIGDDQSITETIDTGADGDVWMQYQVPVDIYIQRTYLKKIYTENTYRTWHVWFGSHRWSLGSNHEVYAQADRIDTWKKFRLTRYFYLPVQIEKNIYKEYKTVRQMYSEEELNQQAQQKISQLIKEVVDAGGYVTDIQTKTDIGDNGYQETGFILVQIPAGQLP